MKKMILTAAIGFLTSMSFAQQKVIQVSGYLKTNGTYVEPHVRTAPDRSFDNNWTTKGNVNPYNGNVGTKTSPTSSSYSTRSNSTFYTTSPSTSRKKTTYNFK